MTREEKNAYMREWRKNNKDKKREANKKYRETHKQEAKEYHKQWREKNRDRINAKARENYHKNPQLQKERKKRYEETHKEQVKQARHDYKINNREKCTTYERNKRHNEPKYRLRCNLINLIRQYTKGKGYKGDKTTYEILGCDFEFFFEYIQGKFKDGMTIDNYGEWNIDHIIPISKAENDEDLEKLNHYTNLQPLWASENFKKSNKIL